MKKCLCTALLLSALLPSLSHAERYLGPSVAHSTSAISLGSSMLVSGLILSPIMLPADLILDSVEKNKQEQAATLTAQAEDGQKVELRVPEKVVDDAKLKAGDKLTLEKAPEGTGALLKKDGKAISHMLYENDAGLSQNKMLTNGK